jgi:2-oxoglutarate dehydrogenase E1 component
MVCEEAIDLSCPFRIEQRADDINDRATGPDETGTDLEDMTLGFDEALDPVGRPLIVMTPKGLLRLKQASSTLADLAEGSFQPVVDDPAAAREGVTRLVFCSGKIYYDIVGHEQRAQAPHVAVARLEQLYPFPVDAYARLVESYPGVREIIWAQEEPQNMGAWRTIRHRLEAPRVPLRYVGRPWRASTAEGYPTAHLVEQDRIVRAAFA